MRYAAVLILLACGAPPKDAVVNLKITRGDADPMSDPGTASRGASPVGSLEVLMVPAGDRQTVPLGAGKTLSVRLPSASRPDARLVLRGLRADDGQLYSAGRSVRFTADEAQPKMVSVFMGPVEAFTPVGEELSSPRWQALSAPLGSVGALIVGGSRAGGLATPALLLYRIDEGRVCAGEACLSGDAVAPRVGGIAVPLADGSVVHGLGGSEAGLEAALYVTTADGATSRLALSGDSLPAIRDPAAIALPDGTLIILGGHDGTRHLRTIFHVDVKNRSVSLQASQLLDARSSPGVALLSTGQLVVAGGAGDRAPDPALDTVEVYTPGAGSRRPDGGGFAQVRTLLRRPRVAPAMIRLADDAVLILGGGYEEGDVFLASLGASVGGLVNLKPALAPLKSANPQAVRLPNGDVLLTGGEAADKPPFAALFTRDPDHVLDEAKPNYEGTFRAAGAGTTVRSQATLTVLPDGAALLAGGSVGVDSPATRVEVFVPAPPE